MARRKQRPRTERPSGLELAEADAQSRALREARRKYIEDRIKKLVADGIPDSAISKRLGVSPETIRAHRVRLGIARPDRRCLLPNGLP